MTDSYFCATVSVHQPDPVTAETNKNLTFCFKLMENCNNNKNWTSVDRGPTLKCGDRSLDQKARCEEL